MLKRRDSPYLPGRPKGLWLKWKRDPHVIDAVLMYAQRGHGKRSGYYSDYTFGVWAADGTLIPVGKAYFGFTDEELARDRPLGAQQHHRPLRPGPRRARRARPRPRARGRLRGPRTAPPATTPASPCASPASPACAGTSPAEADRSRPWRRCFLLDAALHLNDRLGLPSEMLFPVRNQPLPCCYFRLTPTSISTKKVLPLTILESIGCREASFGADRAH